MARKPPRRQYRRHNRIYPEVGLGEGGAQLSPKAWRSIAETYGASPEWAKQYSQVVRGESGYKPGIRGDDPGGTKGWGGPQITPGVQGERFWSFMRNRGWTEEDLRNPHVATRVAIWMDTQAGGTPRKPGPGSWSNWYGTRFLDREVGDVKSVLRGGSRQNGRETTTRIPGVDNSALRQQYLQGYLANRGDPSALLELAQGLEGAQDIPGTVVSGETTLRGRGGRVRDVRTATGQSVNKMLKKAVKWDKSKVPYLWGGGHGSIAKPGQPVDCSGFVSAVLGLDTPHVSGNLASWGKPGKGRWISVYANDGHVLMSIRDPKTRKVRWFGTSSSNPGGGAGEISPPDAGYLSRFAVRHPG
jgi:hypothetical protein